MFHTDLPAAIDGILWALRLSCQPGAFMDNGKPAVLVIDWADLSAAESIAYDFILACSSRVPDPDVSMGEDYSHVLAAVRYVLKQRAGAPNRLTQKVLNTCSTLLDGLLSADSPTGLHQHPLIRTYRIPYAVLSHTMKGIPVIDCRDLNEAQAKQSGLPMSSDRAIALLTGSNRHPDFHAAMPVSCSGKDNGYREDNPLDRSFDDRFIGFLADAERNGHQGFAVFYVANYGYGMLSIDFMPSAWR